MINKKKIVRITTVPSSLGGLLTGQLSHMNQFYEVIAVSNPDNQNLEKYGSKEGVRTFGVELTRKITPFKDLKALFKLYLFFLKEKPDIVHSHTPKAGIVAMLAAYLAKVPNRLHTVAGMPLIIVTGTKRKVLDMVERLTYACATKVLPNSFGLKQFILENKYTTAEKIKVIGKGSSNGIDTQYFSPDLFDENFKTDFKQKLGLPANSFVLLYVGRVVKDKGINELVRVFNRLEEKKIISWLVLVGSYEDDLNPIASDVRKLISNHPRILTLGFQNDVRPYFSIANLLVFPSYREGFPNVVMQAGAMGIPAIVSNINGCNEIIQEGKNGLLIIPQNEKDLEQKLRGYIQNPNLIAWSSSEIRNAIVANYERFQIWQLYREFYSELL